MRIGTVVSGYLRVEPPLNRQEVAYLQAFNATRRVLRQRGPYAVHDDRSGQESLQPRAPKNAGADIIDMNSPAEGQPGLWCPWTVSDDGLFVQWDEQAVDGTVLAPWLAYLLGHFLIGEALRDHDVRRAGESNRFASFSFDHEVFGVTEMRGEEPDDRWALSVHGRELVMHQAVFAYRPPLPARDGEPSAGCGEAA